jgi:hypothetical protein
MYQILKTAACIDCDPSRRQRLAGLVAKGTNWDALIKLAEEHGLAPLLFRSLQEAGVAVPLAARRQMHGILLSYRHSNRQRIEVLGRLIDAFRAEDITAVVLKGGALSMLLYPDPGLRPMSDLDILVPPERAQRAQAILEEQEFHVPAAHSSRFMQGHHHLPGASRREDGTLLAVEIHVDALGHDRPEPLTLAQLDVPLRPYSVDGSQALVLGHVDMLRQLIWHALGPAECLRLIWVVDVLEYAARFVDEIDWAWLGARRPEVLNALSLFAQVLPLPGVLQDKVPRYLPDPVPGAGEVCPPLSRILSRHRGTLQRLQVLYYPSDWWLRAYYGVPSGRGIGWCRWVTHTLRLGSWFLRRAASAVG